ncbi:TrkH family potassium uptake protein [Chitinibacteraceae bacterium HSL-7]
MSSAFIDVEPIRYSVAHQLLPTVNVLARVAVIFSLTMLLPIVVAWYGNDAGLMPFVESLGALLLTALIIVAATMRFRRELGIRDGFVLVVGLWTTLPAIAAVPLMLYKPELRFTYAYFEAMSGLSTTGATVLSGLDTLPPSINLWRHLLNWLGGMGILVLAVAILPMLGIGGMQLFKAETPGPIKDAKLTPRIRETARNLWLIYAALTALCALALRATGEMGWFDALCHAMAALSLGGFSTRDASVGYYNSPLIEGILIVFMLLAATNFATHFLALTRVRLSVYWKDSEFKAMMAAIIVATLGLAAYLWQHQTYDSYTAALRAVAFNLVSLATDCGFASTDFGAWPLAVPLTMLLLSCMCACAGSTGGGIKMLRTITLVRQAGRQFVLLLHPRAVRPLRVNHAVLPEHVINAVLGFIFVYFLAITGLTFALLFSGLDFISSFSAIIACINNAGPGLNEVGPAANYGGLSPFQIWICAFAMLLGRLELFSVLVLFTPAFWRR